MTINNVKTIHIFDHEYVIMTSASNDLLNTICRAFEKQKNDPDQLSFLRFCRENYGVEVEVLEIIENIK